MEETTKIYGLVSTRDLSDIRYIGKTKNSLQLRLHKHNQESRNIKSNSWKNRWVRKELKYGYKIKIIQLDEVWSEDWEFWEIYYIAEYKRLGYKLTNGTPGGDAQYNPGNARSIVVLKRSGGYVGQFDSIAESSRKLNIPLPGIERCLYGKYKSTKCYQFIYAEDYDPNKNYNIVKQPKKYIPVPREQRLKSLRENSLKAAIKNRKPVAAYYPDGRLYKIWESRKAAAEELDSHSPKGIDKALSGEKPRWRGFVWKHP